MLGLGLIANIKALSAFDTEARFVYVKSHRYNVTTLQRNTVIAWTLGLVGGDHILPALGSHLR